MARVPSQTVEMTKSKLSAEDLDFFRKQGSVGGKKSAALLSAEERRERAKRASMGAAPKMTAAQRREAKRKERRDYISNLGGTPKEIAAAGSRGGKASAASLTPERRKLRAKKAALTRFGKGDSVVYEPKTKPVRKPPAVEAADVSAYDYRAKGIIDSWEKRLTSRKSYTLRPSPELLRAAQQKARKEHASIRSVLLELLQKWVDGKV